LLTPPQSRKRKPKRTWKVTFFDVGVEDRITGILHDILSHIRSDLRKAKIGYVGLGVEEDRIVLEVRNPSRLEESVHLVKRDWPKVAISRADTSFEVFFDQKELSRIRRDILVQTLNAVSVYLLGHGIDVDGVRAQGDRCIVVPPSAANQIKKLMKKLKQNLRSKSKIGFQSFDTSIDPNQEDVPPGFKVLGTYKETFGETLSRFVVRRRIFLSGEHVVDTSFTMANGQLVLVITLDIVGEQLVLQRLPDTVQQLAITRDYHDVLAIAQADRRQPDRMTVLGDLTMERAQKLATIVRASSTPASVTIVDACAE